MRATRRHARRSALAVVFGTLLAALSPPAGAAAETLAQALSYTYRSNPQLNAERARQRSDDHNVRRALSGYFPSVVIDAGFGPTVDQDVSVRGGGTLTSPLSLGLTVNQTIFDFGRTAAAVRGAETGVLAGREALRGVEQTVLLAAVNAYMNILRDKAIVDLQRGNTEFFLEVARIARKRVETGDLRPTDLAQADARLARAQADLASAEADLVASRAAYRQAVGREPAGLVFPEARPRVPKGLREARAEGMGQSPAIRNALLVIDVAATEVSAAIAETRPSLGVQGTTARTIGRGANVVVNQPPLSSTLGLNVPIYSGGAEYALVRQAKETMGQRRFELETAREQVDADIRNVWGLLEAARASVPAAETSVVANGIALAGVQREAGEGQRTTLDVLNAQQELVNARTTLITARRDLVVATYALLSATGGLTASRLNLVGERYRPEVHYYQVRELHVGARTPDGR